jgi:hypothetical protein
MNIYILSKCVVTIHKESDNVYPYRTDWQHSQAQGIA